MDTYAKAIAAFFGALNVWGMTALADGSITASEWVGGVCSVALAVAAVWGVTNAPTSSRKRDPQGRFTI